jgi:hypothetical protein
MEIAISQGLAFKIAFVRMCLRGQLSSKLTRSRMFHEAANR